MRYHFNNGIFGNSIILDSEGITKVLSFESQPELMIFMAQLIKDV